MKNFSQFLEMKYLEWQQKQGGRKTLTEFAIFLGVAQNTMSSYLKGKRKPEGEIIRKLAEKLGLETYDVLGVPKPDADLFYLQIIWKDLDHAHRHALRQQAERYKVKKK